MSNKEIIIFLITQEIKHTKFLHSLSNIGLEPEDHYITVLDGIYPLMKSEIELPKDTHFPKMTDHLVDIYYRAIERIKDYPHLNLSREFESLAEACYNLVISHIKSEINKQKELVNL